MTESEKKTDHTIEVTVPYSATDLAKATRSIIATLRDLGEFARDAGEFYDRRKARAAARHLDSLSFGRGGMRDPLARIASGDWLVEDLDSIEQQLKDTAEQIETDINELSKYRDHLREKYGKKAADKLDTITNWSNDPNDSERDKPWLRDKLEMLVRNARAYDYGRVEIRPEDRQYMEDQLKWIQDTAIWLGRKIDDLNKRIVEIHDMVLPSTK
jgi:hypothetical protein